MLKTKVNLECAHGHRWFAPDPSAFVGRPCGAGLSGMTRAKSCEQPLTRIVAARPPV